MPVICVTCDSNANSGYSGGRHLDSPSTYSRALAYAGAVPVAALEYCPEELAGLCDGLLLTGGVDIEPSLYGEEVLNHTVITDPSRTSYELCLTRAFLQKKKPILAICRGFQLLNCILGGTLYQDLVEQLGYVHNHPDIRHGVTTLRGSVLYRYFGCDFKTNSTHHQAVRKLGNGLYATAYSAEGIIEAYEHEELPILGTQFHPECLTNLMWDGRTPDFAPYFKYFIGLCRPSSAPDYSEKGKDYSSI